MQANKHEFSVSFRLAREGMNRRSVAASRQPQYPPDWRAENVRKWLVESAGAVWALSDFGKQLPIDQFPTG